MFALLQKKLKPKLFWVSAMGPMVVVLVGCLVAYLVKGAEHGIQTVSKFIRFICTFIYIFNKHIHMYVYKLKQKKKKKTYTCINLSKLLHQKKKKKKLKQTGFKSWVTRFLLIVYFCMQVGPLKKGLNPPSIQYLNFDAKYLPVVLKAGIITGLIAMAVNNYYFHHLFFRSYVYHISIF